MALVAHNGLWLTRQGFAPDPLHPLSPGVSPVGPQGVLHDGIVQAMASGELRLAAGSNLQIYSAMGGVKMGAGTVTDVVTIRQDGVDVRGSLRILGTLDAVASSDLQVRDKLVRVSHEGAGCNLSDEVLDGSGIALGSDAQLYERSVRWRKGLAESAQDASMAPGATSNAGFWEVMGGGLRITCPTKADPNRRVSYGMHINEQEELVMYKAWSAAPDKPMAYQRVFTFGSTSTPLQLPTSSNPYF
jgi:hypothetical protein